MASARSISPSRPSIALGIVLLAATYRPPPNAVAAVAVPRRGSIVTTIMAVIVAGLIWGLFNIGFAMIFSFGPSMLVERGWSITAAGSAISIVLWLAVFSVPFGGFLADRTRRPQSILVAGSIVFAMLMLCLPRSERGDPDRDRRLDWSAASRPGRS